MNHQMRTGPAFPKDEIHEDNFNQELIIRKASPETVNESSDSDDMSEKFDSMLHSVIKNEEIIALENELYNLMLEDTLKTQKGLPGKYLRKIKKMKVGFATKQCSVCVSSFASGDIIRKLPCGHIYHEYCLKPWLKKHANCPLCRMDLLEYFEKATE